jgi:hypothetical protein
VGIGSGETIYQPTLAPNAIDERLAKAPEMRMSKSHNAQDTGAKSFEHIELEL